MRLHASSLRQRRLREQVGTGPNMARDTLLSKTGNITSHKPKHDVPSFSAASVPIQICRPRIGGSPVQASSCSEGTGSLHDEFQRKDFSTIFRRRPSRLDSISRALPGSAPRFPRPLRFQGNLARVLQFPRKPPTSMHLPGDGVHESSCIWRPGKIYSSLSKMQGMFCSSVACSASL